MTTTRSSAFAEIVAAIRRGETSRGAAAHLGLTADFAEAVADEAIRLGLISSFRGACGTCSGPVGSISCLGCPLLEPGER